MSVFSPGDHGSTFGGNPPACAVAIEALEPLVEKGLPSMRRGSGSTYEALRAPPSCVREARRQGLPSSA